MNRQSTYSADEGPGCLADDTRALLDATAEVADQPVTEALARGKAAYVRWGLWGCFLLSLPSVVNAVLFYSTADPAHNTNAPAGALNGSGWQYQGSWGAFLGTPIAPQYFLAASHVGGTVGDKIRFRGVDYTTTAVFDDTNSDLRLWRICGTFPEYAPLYSLSTELAQAVVVFGRGTQRGVEVISSGLFPAAKGWQWGAGDGVQRWGTNVVSAIINGDTMVPLFGVSSGPVGDLLKCAFDASGGADEAHLSGGDSSGGLFIQDNGVWKLAGINYAVDGPYNTTNSGSGTMAAIFDEGGLYKGGQGNWSLTPDIPIDLPGAFYATRVSTHIAWINSILQSAVANSPPTLKSATDVIGSYEDAQGAVVDTTAKTITVPLPSGTSFFRLQACDPTRITGIRISGTTLVISY